MAKIPYAPIDRSEDRELVRAIIEQRGEVLHIYQMLLHSPPVAEGWLKLLTAIRQQTSLPGASRELIIVRIAHLNGAPYEAEQHAAIALREGCSQSQLDALVDWEKQRDLFGEKERAALTLTDFISRNLDIDDATWRSVRNLWSEQEIVELTATIASYNMVSRFLRALHIDSTDPRSL